MLSRLLKYSTKNTVDINTAERLPNKLDVIVAINHLGVINNELMTIIIIIVYL